MRNLIKVMLLVSIYMFVFSTTSFASFSDIDSHWCEEKISDFEKSGFVEGYEDNTFRPDNEITRAEFCKIINSYMGYSVSGDWEISNMNMAKEKGYLTVGDARDLITREEAFVVLARLMSVDFVECNVEYEDINEISAWAMPAIKSLTYTEYIEGYENNEIRPKHNMTRAELVKILYNYIGVGGLDEEIESLEFTIGYMKHNKYGLEFIEIEDILEIECQETIMLAATASEEDGDIEFEVISGDEFIEFDEESLLIEAFMPGEVKIKAITQNSNKEKIIILIIQ
ncbi:MAG: S-layer homology domain-containing protein [Clostridia bacterium]|nr:S-layer homology domain-containing protein [Clostridia bacterium]